MVDSDCQSLVIDIGSCFTKCGFSGDDAPCAVFPTVVGRNRMMMGMMVQENYVDFYVGDEAVARRGICRLHYPLPTDRKPNDFYYLDKVLTHTFGVELRSPANHQPVFLTRSFDMTRKSFRDLSESIFETHKAPFFHICDSSLLSLYATGRTTGTVLEMGHGVTLSQPVYEGEIIHHSKLILEDQMNPSMKRINGDLLNDTFIQLLAKTKAYPYENITGSERQFMNEIKEKSLFLSPKLEREIETFENIEKQNADHPDHIEYTLPDSSVIRLGLERNYAPEIYFQPSLIGYDRLVGIHHLIKRSIDLCHPHLFDTMFSNLMVCGGCSLIENLIPRLKNEISNIIPKSTRLHFANIDPTWRKNSSWIGGSILTSLSTFEDSWVSKKEYDEYGQRIVEAKCTNCSRNNDQIGIFQNILRHDTDFKERTDFVIQKENEGNVIEIVLQGDCTLGRFLKSFLNM